MFQGFSEGTIQFLQGLKENNNKAWFEANKPTYQNFVQEPLRELVDELGPFMLSIDALFEISPKKAISRINRDIRFSHDKSPYRSNMWISFKRQYLDWKAEPTYFFEIFPDFYRYGMGFYCTPRETMDKLREMIDEKKKDFQQIHHLYQSQNIFRIEGEKYKRILNANLTAELNEWYQRKEVYFVCNRNIDELLFEKELVPVLRDGFKILEPFYHYFLRLKK
ncbi:DUF2461 domain-containing protein [Candidatus Formimonas warabiya]|uniref:DUF2461 domain-containing protein n=1 Tax=Formimonas warabiya TaxID=1761012 RepID=A0A3G1L0B8_FORW1|nr:DUF2461 domain-containing protein [Candidatus Formimonas warabiya]ATW28236.1 hypothetical protein DCMF_28860 [Candidatus Formimonas warabiya]